MLVTMGMSQQTAATGDRRDPPRREPGAELPSCPGARRRPAGEAVAAGWRPVSSFVMFAIGAIVPLIPYLLGFESLWAGLIAAASAC